MQLAWNPAPHTKICWSTKSMPAQRGELRFGVPWQHSLQRHCWNCMELPLCGRCPDNGKRGWQNSRWEEQPAVQLFLAIGFVVQFKVGARVASVKAHFGELLLFPQLTRRSRWQVMHVSAQFVRMLARSRARSAPHVLRSGATAAYVSRWSSLLSFAAARAVAASLRSLLLGNAANVDGAALDLSDVLAETFSAPPLASRLPLRASP